MEPRPLLPLKPVRVIVDRTVLVELLRLAEQYGEFEYPEDFAGPLARLRDEVAAGQRVTLEQSDCPGGGDRD